MIEQVLYRRTIEQGYIEYSSRGMTKEEAHNINVVMDTVASQITDLGSGSDAPFMIYPFPETQNVCIATFQREFSKGRSNSVNHAILIPQDEYQKLGENPENLWGFTYKNFLSRKVNHRGEMFTLKKLDTVENPELDKEWLFQEYHLNNQGFLHFLTAIYTSLSKSKNYTCGIEIDNSRDANKVMRHFGYLIMSMLPFGLRDRASFCSRNIPETVKLTVQVLLERNAAKPDVTYNLNSEECTVNNANIDITNFYLNDLLDMSNASLKNYFEHLDAFKNNLNLAENCEVDYVIIKLFKLSQCPELFATETAENQLVFINDAFSLPTEKTDIINSIVVSLLPYIDPRHHMEVFNINLGLYRKLHLGKASDQLIASQIENNLLMNYANATSDEKIRLFKTIFNTDKNDKSVYKLLKRFLDENDIQIDTNLLELYISLYEKLFDIEGEALYRKISTVFINSDVSEKVKIWDRLYTGTNKEASGYFMYNILDKEDEPFEKAIFSNIVSLFQNAAGIREKERYYGCITNVIRKENDDYRIRILSRYNDTSEELENLLWARTYNSIEDYKKAAQNPEFIRCLEEKFYNSSHSKIRNLYLHYLCVLPVTEIENIIHNIECKSIRTERDTQLLQEITHSLLEKKQKISVSTLKELTEITEESGVDELAVYIREVYLSDDSGEEKEIYEFLENEQNRIFTNPNLNKEKLWSFGHYYALQLSDGILKDKEQLWRTLKYLDMFAYPKETYDKIFPMYQKYIDQEFSDAGSDYDRFLIYKQICADLDCIIQTRFGMAYAAALKENAKACFWNASNSSTFSYEHCSIYRDISEVYSPQYAEHENHILAENINGLIYGGYVDWDKVYKFLLSRDYIEKDNVRIQIAKDFMKRYRNEGLRIQDPAYIAFVCVHKTTLKMDYMSLFDNLQKYGYPIDDKSIREMMIFRYIPVSEKLCKKITQYRNFQSDNPSYGDVIRGLLFEQIGVLAVLLADNIVSSFFLKMSDDMNMRNIGLLCSYIVYIIVIIGGVVVSVILMCRANRRRSYAYDGYVFGLLIVNLVITIAATIFSIIFWGSFIDIAVSAVALVIAITVNMRSRNILLRRHHKSIKKQGGGRHE